MEDAAKCKKPSKAEVGIVYKQFRREGVSISESETAEFLNLVCDAKIETDPTRNAKMQKRLLAILPKLEKASKSLSGLLMN